MRPWTLRLLPILTLPFVGCGFPAVENGEEITVNSDGSVVVTVTAQGKAFDLAGGYSVPLHSPWFPTGEDTALWLREIGPDTGGAGIREVVQDKQETLWGERTHAVKLSARAVFPSVADLPQFLAPRDAACRSAYLGRETSHEVRELEGRRVHVFERTYEPRDYRRFSPMGRTGAEASEELKAALQGALARAVEESDLPFLGRVWAERWSARRSPRK